MHAPRTRYTAPRDALPRPPHWSDDAQCRTSKTPDYWFAEGHDDEAVAEREEAKRVCGLCPSRPDCLHAALERGEVTGVWGGLDADEREQLTLLPTAREPTTAKEGTDGPPAPQARTA
jgi:WhiB family redox-sensing transcriptional regulator